MGEQISEQITERISEKGKRYHSRISAEGGALGLQLSELYRYRELILMFTVRNFTLSYKQTILGPLWIVIRPFAASVIQMIIFGRVARIPTDGIPMILFYLFGNALWGFFASCVGSTANTFASNAYLFGKVYFPRLTVPLSQVLTAFIGYLVQILPGVFLYLWYLSRGEVQAPGPAVLLIPLLMLVLGLMGMGVGIIASSLTTRYRDLQVLVGFGMSLWMYLTPVVYPLSISEGSGFRNLLLMNPVTAPMEFYRYALFHRGSVLPPQLACSVLAAGILLAVGIPLFQKVERTFMDTI